MKFIMLKSRGGDYMVVAENVAYLRAHENGQTKVGLVGGDSILVAGCIEETAATILAGCAASPAKRCAGAGPAYRLIEFMAPFR
jgi:hypothetical protein